MVNELVKLKEQPIGAPVDLKDFIASTLIQIVEGVAQSAEAVSKVGGVNLPLFNVPLSRSIMRPSIAVPRASVLQIAWG